MHNYGKNRPFCSFFIKVIFLMVCLKKKGQCNMKNKIELINNKSKIENGIIRQVESTTETLQMIYQTKECPKDIANVLYNQIGLLVILQEELENLFALSRNVA